MRTKKVFTYFDTNSDRMIKMGEFHTGMSEVTEDDRIEAIFRNVALSRDDDNEAFISLEDLLLVRVNRKLASKKGRIDAFLCEVTNTRIGTPLDFEWTSADLRRVFGFSRVSPLEA